MHLKQWYYSLHRDFQNCYSTRRSLARFFSSNSNSNSTRVPIHHPHLHVHIQRILHPEIQFYMQKTKSSSSTTTTTYRGQRDLQSRFQKRNSTHRRQGDLLEMHPCVLQDLPITFQAFQPQDLPKALQLLQLLQRHSRHSSHSWPFSLSRQFYNVPVSPGNPPNSSILLLECIFYIFYIFYSSIGFHRKLHRVPVGQLQTLQTFILQRKGDVAISVKLTYSPE